MPQFSMLTPIGELAISEDDGHIVALDWGSGKFQDETPLLKAARDQLNAYFDGKLKHFDLPLLPAGSAHQIKVWGAMCEIPPGEVMAYGELAKRIRSSAQAVGQACGSNPIPIIIPCHRVVTVGKRPGGHSGDGGAETKCALLAIEGAPGFEPRLI